MSKAFIIGGSGGSGAFTVPELSADPASPPLDTAWILATKGGKAIVFLGLWVTALTSYQLSYKAYDGTIVRVTLTAAEAGH